MIESFAELGRHPHRRRKSATRSGTRPSRGSRSLSSPRFLVSVRFPRMPLLKTRGWKCGFRGVFLRVPRGGQNVPLLSSLPGRAGVGSGCWQVIFLCYLFVAVSPGHFPVVVSLAVVLDPGLADLLHQERRRVAQELLAHVPDTWPTRQLQPGTAAAAAAAAAGRRAAPFDQQRPGR